uniref:C2H2-type domain-containing protein n=1 Tax=Lates calcarifer TaxID=8187 RepID=A0A4W6G3X2_LATCA
SLSRTCTLCPMQLINHDPVSPLKALSVYGTEITVRLCLVRSPGTDMAVFCLLCAKRFQTQKALQQHMEVHAGDHPFECEFCGSCFRDDGTLRGHKRIHTGEKPYECNGCGKRFSLKHQLETHYRVHTGESSEIKTYSNILESRVLVLVPVKYYHEKAKSNNELIVLTKHCLSSQSLMHLTPLCHSAPP